MLVSHLMPLPVPDKTALGWVVFAQSTGAALAAPGWTSRTQGSSDPRVDAK